MTFTVDTDNDSLYNKIMYYFVFNFDLNAITPTGHLIPTKIDRKFEANMLKKYINSIANKEVEEVEEVKLNKSSKADLKKI